jgi:hypothetical protein
MDGGVPTATFTNLQNGEPLTNDVLVLTWLGEDDWGRRALTFYDGGIAADTTIFLPGFHSVLVSVSDGSFTVTNSASFEVISFDTALQELRARLEPLAINRAGRKAVAFFDAALRADEQEREKLTGRRWRHFQRQFARVTALDEEERRELSLAATQIQALLQNE